MKNELRLGNYINKFNRVLYITDHGLICTGLSMTGVILIEDPEPIPLTEDILLKCCFEKDVEFKAKFNFLRFHLFQINASNNWNDNVNEFKVTVYQSKQSIEICRLKHLHQLQNLIHSLTNEELNINL